MYIFHDTAQHRRAADAAGAAPGLGAILRHGGVPSFVSFSKGCQRRR